MTLSKITTVIINHFDILAPLVALAFVLCRKNRRLGEHICIVVYLCAQLLINGTAKYWMYFHKNESNCFIYQINCCISVVILSVYCLIKYLPAFSKPVYRVFYVSSVLIALTSLGFLVYYEDNRVFNSHSFGFSALTISAYAVTYYYQRLLNPVIEKITYTRSFWFISGLFIYYSGSFFIFSTYMVFTNLGNKHFSILWSIHNVIFLIMCIFISKGFLCKPSRQISS